MVDKENQRKGLGSKLYNKVIAEKGVLPLTCEVSVNPENTNSIYFHENIGFKEVGAFFDNNKQLRMYVLR